MLLSILLCEKVERPVLLALQIMHISIIYFYIVCAWLLQVVAVFSVGCQERISPAATIDECGVTTYLP